MSKIKTELVGGFFTGRFWYTPPRVVVIEDDNYRKQLENTRKELRDLVIKLKKPKSYG